MKRKTIFLILTVGLVIGLAVWWFLTRPVAPETAGAQPDCKVLYWHDPMVPGYRSEKPGKSPFMDMQLVPACADEASGVDTQAITIRPAIINNLGVRTEVVKRQPLVREATAQGYLFRGSGGLMVLADIFERDTSWVRAGLSAEIRVSDLPGRSWQATVERVESDTDIGARNLKVRLRVRDHDAILKSNTPVDAVIRADSGKQVLAIPREALIRTGSRSAVVRALGDGRFEPVLVVPGIEFGEQVEIRAGLKEGERVVTSGQFLIDSEASLRASFMRMGSPDENATRPEQAP